MTAIKEDIAERVKRLLALAASSNVEEATSAWAKAQKMLIQHNLTLDQLQEKQSDPLDKYHAVLVRHSNRDRWRPFLLHTIAIHHLCTSVSNTGTGTSGVIGTQTNVDVVIQMYTFIVDQIELLANKAYANAITYHHPRTWKKGFYHGVVATLSKRLSAEQTKMTTPVTPVAAPSLVDGETITEHNTLAVQSRALIIQTTQELDQATAKYYPKLKKGSRVTIKAPSAFETGQQAGYAVRIRRELA